MKYPATLAIGAALVSSVACTKAPTQAAASQSSARMRIESLPAGDPQKFHDVRKMRDWKNPYLIVRADGVALLDVSDNEEKLLTPDQLLDALGNLPTSAWPYGRVVAVAESATATSDSDKARLRKNRALVAGSLQNMQILINWVPAA